MLDVSNESEWITGRVGMLYRDLTPDGLKPRVVVSQIRLPFDGEVPDYVHYHKVEFQLIYCTKGRIKVVYEDQGEPFWLETGDCVLQPPEIRHRVLECTEGAEVIEVTMPAEHETCVEHDIELPTSNINPQREFNGQRFLRYREALSSPFRGSGYVKSDTGVAKASNGRASLTIYSFEDKDNNSSERGWFVGTGLELVYVLDGELTVRTGYKELPNSFERDQRFAADSCLVLKPNTSFSFNWSPDLKLLAITISR